MKKLLGTIAIGALTLTGCGGDDGKKAGVVNFTSFVKQQVVETDNTLTPVEINRFIFIDRDRNNDQAYDDVLADM